MLLARGSCLVAHGSCHGRTSPIRNLLGHAPTRDAQTGVPSIHPYDASFAKLLKPLTASPASPIRRRRGLDQAPIMCCSCRVCRLTRGRRLLPASCLIPSPRSLFSRPWPLGEATDETRQGNTAQGSRSKGNARQPPYHFLFAAGLLSRVPDCVASAKVGPPGGPHKRYPTSRSYRSCGTHM